MYKQIWDLGNLSSNLYKNTWLVIPIIFVEFATPSAKDLVHLARRTILSPIQFNEHFNYGIAIIHRQYN